MRIKIRTLPVGQNFLTTRCIAVSLLSVGYFNVAGHAWMYIAVECYVNDAGLGQI